MTEKTNAPSRVLPDDFPGTAVSIFDGETFEVLHSHHAKDISLSGIDYLEKRQAYGQRSK